jgi:hypothetical protein
MRRALAIAAVGGIVAGGGAMLAAPGQDRPGVIGQARVFVENRGRGDAVPVVLQDVMTASPIVVQARLARQPWEYRTLNLQPGQDPATALSGPGADGWEATGIQLTASGSGVILLKRPRLP